MSRTLVTIYNRMSIDDYTLVNQILSAKVTKGTESSIFHKVINFTKLFYIFAINKTIVVIVDNTEFQFFM